jgi:hypothetical protein
MGIEYWHEERRNSLSEMVVDKGLEGLTSLNSKKPVKSNP